MQLCLKRIIALALVCAFATLEVILLKEGQVGDSVPTPVEAEAWELKGAILWLGDMRMSSVSTELHCKLVTDDTVDKSTNQSEFEFDKFENDCKIPFSNYP